MGSLLLLVGMLLLMMSLIWTTGEALKKGLQEGVIALLFMPIYSGFYTFYFDYAKWHRPFFVSIAGIACSLIGYFINR